MYVLQDLREASKQVHGCRDPAKHGACQRERIAVADSPGRYSKISLERQRTRFANGRNNNSDTGEE